ncbi:unnamed protein product [Parascedosporium putredinis]|uniref:Spindle pole body component n=1 Tax=Parascedosporium putredinis TaxID=1442378 RepID=A0A9P1MBW3_9PEZI|nr:unnamed protein product [Parascedosporium putredinis]CAI7995531.1 unnamed protein product [Parascedosporium putredinis]
MHKAQAQYNVQHHVSRPQHAVDPGKLPAPKCYQNATMPPNNNKLVDAVDRLITHIIPTNPREGEDAAQKGTMTVLSFPASPAISSDVNHASDMIKRKLIQSNPSQALRFSNLYSRLLSLPVLKQKWAILYLLYQLADSPDPDEPLPSNQPRPAILSRPVAADEEVFNEAFAQGGLKKFPPQPREAKRADEEKERHTPDATKESPKREVALKSRHLADNYVDIDPSEPSLLRDLPFTLQGLSSTTMPFERLDTLSLPPTLPAPIISLLHTLAEPSLLYKSLDTFVKSQVKGLLGQSLRAAISTELKSYLSLIATLEVQIRRALASLDEDAPRRGIGKAGVTLKRCVVWTREATMGLRLMCLIAEESEKQRGGKLISMIHSYSSSYGDPMVAAFAERLLGQFTRPFFDILRHWIYDGELLDPYLEFFVREQAHGENDANKAKSGETASGKTILKAASKELRYGDTARLEAWIDEAYKTTMKRLMDLMETKFHLFEHLQALKNYILLGQGDFIALLMESLAAYLDRPASAQYRHTLTAQLENAIRGSNAQYDSPEVLRRLDARMLQLSHGDIGWDCFTLEYKIDAPVDVVVTEWGNRQYLKVFNFLWRIKRVEFALASTWRKCMTGARGVLQNGDPAVEETWKSTRGVLAEMIHFVGQLQYYILFEVIESSWGELQKRIRREGCTLDDLIKAHTRYLNDITHKGLLGARRRHAVDPVTGEDDRTSYLSQLGDLLRTMLAYRSSVDGLYSWSVSDFTRRQEADVRVSTLSRLRAGPIDDGLTPGPPGTSFRTRLQILLGDLAYQPDVDMRFLGVAMNFNDVYQPARRKTKAPQSASSAVGAGA